MSKVINSPSPHPIPNKDETSNSPIPIPIVPSPLLGLGESSDFDYWDRGDLISKAMEELDWPDRDRSLLEWYFDRLGPNRFLTVWQDQSFENEKRPPRSKYNSFRARLSKALGHEEQLPNPQIQSQIENHKSKIQSVNR